MMKIIRSLNVFLLMVLFSLSVVAQQVQPPKIVNGGVINGKAKELPKPEYPEAARAVKASGTVNVNVTIDENGNVISASAVSGHPLLRVAALNAAKQAKFTPTKLSGQPVKVTGVIVYNFVADEIKLHLAALARNLTLIQRLPWSDEVKTQVERLAAVIPKEFPAEQQELITVAKTNGFNRVNSINKILDSFEEKMPENDAWQMKLGRVLAEIEFDVHNQIADSSVQLDEEKLRKNLETLNSLTYSQPSEISTEITTALRKITDYANQPSLKNSDSLIGLMQAYTDFLKIVSPGNYK